MHSVSTSFTPQSAKLLIDDLIAAYVADKLTAAGAVSPSYQRLWQAIEQSMRAGGKRFRPYLLLATYQGFNGSGAIEDILPAALAQECLHVAMLVHDDIIDRDLRRHGQPTIEARYRDTYQSFLTAGDDVRHFATSAAILAGDILLAEAQALIGQTRHDPELVRQAAAEFTTGIFEVVGGELLDTEASFMPADTVDPLAIARYKTASYSFTSPLVIGALLAGGNRQDIGRLRVIGHYLGTGYQLRDDILGSFGDPAITGKADDGDISEGKQTLLVTSFIQRATSEQRAQFVALYGRSGLTGDQLQTIRKLLTDSGAVAAVEALIDQQLAAIRPLVDELDVSADFRRQLQDIIERCLYRTA